MADLNKLLAKKQSDNKGKTDKSIPVENAESILNTVREIDISLIVEDEKQPRKEYNAEKITALAESVEEKGLIQPIIVKQDGKKYLIVAGHRRYRAFKQLGKTAIPCIVKTELMTDSDLTELALIENLQREDLNTLEIAESIYQLKQIRSIKQQEIATITGYSEGNISKYIQLFNAVKDDSRKQKTVISKGFKRSYNLFCADKNRTEERARAKAKTATLLITVKDITNRKELEAGIKQTSEFLAYLQGLLANSFTVKPSEKG